MLQKMFLNSCEKKGVEKSDDVKECQTKVAPSTTLFSKHISSLASKQQSLKIYVQTKISQ